jgi:hypothetical protein
MTDIVNFADDLLSCFNFGAQEDQSMASVTDCAAGDDIPVLEELANS